MKVDRYTLRLFIFRSADEFRGEVKISLTGHWPNLALDAVNMDLSVVRVNGSDCDYTYDGKTILFGSEINGTADIYIEYKARYSQTLTGIYRAGRSKKSMISTQLEASGARLVFPCIDHPEFKAEFDLTVVTDRSSQVISNMPVRGETLSTEGRIVEFQRTPRMSTYLLYIGVGEFDVKSMESGGVKVYLATEKGRFRSTEEPLKAAVTILQKLSSYFGIPYMLPKLHLISVPEFASGAMENWGAVTFREDALLMNRSTSEYSKAVIKMVIAHELAHHWFGDLVTMKWWSDIWLNESFANFMGYRTVDEIDPEYDMWAMYLESETSRALHDDALECTHPIVSVVNTPEEIEQAFDDITYGKGGALLRMIEYFMGPENFRDGIRDYLRKYSYGNADSSNLWEELDRHSDINISSIMEEWVVSAGHPIIFAEEDGERIKLKQRTFFLSGIASNDVRSIPLTVVREDRMETALFNSQEMAISGEGFIKLNKNFSGFYRVFYSDSLYGRMATHLHTMTEYDLWEILNNNFDFLIAGLISLEMWMERIRQMETFDHFLLVRSISSQFLQLSRILHGDQRIMEEGRRYITQKMERFMTKGWLKDSRMRITVEKLCSCRPFFDSDYAASSALRINEIEKMEPELRQSVLTSHALVNNDASALQRIFNSLENEDDRLRCLNALSYTTGDDNHTVVERMVEDGGIKVQDLLSLYSGMATTEDGRAYILDNFRSIYERYRRIFASSLHLTVFIESIVPALALHDYERAEKICNDLKAPDETRGSVKALETMKINRNFIERVRSGGH